jgi:transposase
MPLRPRKADNFKQSRAVGAWLGLTWRRFQSGEADYDGHILRRGDRQLRALLYEAAAVLLTRVRRESVLRRWGFMLWKRLGFKRAATALARKMALSKHKMNSELIVFVLHLLVVESRCPCRDVGKAISVASLRLIQTAHETVGGRTLERPSCAGAMPAAETTLLPVYSATSKTRVDSRPINKWRRLAEAATPPTTRPRHL